MYKESVKYGLIGGAILIAYGLITIIFGMENFVNFGIYMLTFAFLIFWIFFSVYKQRKANGGQFSFLNALLSGLIAFGVMTLLSTVFNLVYFNVVNPQAKFELSEMIIDSTLNTMENWNAPQEAIDDFIENDAAEMHEQFSTGGLIKSYFTQFIMGFIFSLIAALIFKRKPLSNNSTGALDDSV